jgi:hypothetical protein
MVEAEVPEGGGDMTHTLVPHLRHRWTVVATSSGQLHLRCATCHRTAALDRLNRRTHQHREKVVAQPAP